MYEEPIENLFYSDYMLKKTELEDYMYDEVIPRMLQLPDSSDVEDAPRDRNTDPEIQSYSEAYNNLKKAAEIFCDAAAKAFAVHEFDALVAELFSSYLDYTPDEAFDAVVDEYGYDVAYEVAAAVTRGY